MLLPLAFSQRELKPSRPDPVSLSKTSGSTTCLENSEKRDKTRKVLGCVLGERRRGAPPFPHSQFHQVFPSEAVITWGRIQLSNPQPVSFPDYSLCRHLRRCGAPPSPLAIPLPWSLCPAPEPGLQTGRAHATPAMVTQCLFTVREGD